MSGDYNETDQIWEVNIANGVVFEISKRTIPHLPSDIACVKEDYVERIFRIIFGDDNISAKLVEQFVICEKIEIKMLYTGDSKKTSMIAFEKNGRVAVVPEEGLNEENKKALLTFFVT